MRIGISRRLSCAYAHDIMSVTNVLLVYSNYQKAKNIMNNSKNRHLKTLNKIPRIIFLFSIIATIISIIVLCSIPGNRETISCDYESFSNGWVTDNGSKADFTGYCFSRGMEFNGIKVRGFRRPKLRSFNLKDNPAVRRVLDS